MERENDPATLAKIEADIKTARENGVHIDAAVNPFISEEDRQEIIKGLAQDPEWD